MLDGANGDLFDPRRLRQLWERPEEDEFEKQAREERELREAEPAIVAIDLFEEIVHSCERNLGPRVARMAPLLKHARGLLAMKLAADRNEAAAAAPPAADAPPADAPPAAAAETAEKPKDTKTELKEKVVRESGVRSSERPDAQAKEAIVMMMERAGLTKAIVAAPEAKPAELGAALDAIEDLYATLSFGGAARRHAAAHGAPGSEEEDGNNVLNEVVNVVEENIEDGADTAMNALGEGEAE